MLRLKVKDFQSVREADIRVEGLTVLVGRSNLGKSALVRAVRALQQNQPGEAFVRKGAPHAEVVLETEGATMLWRKGGGHNAYQINGTDYVDVGRGAPEAVRAAGWGDLHVGEGEDPLSVQVADQFEPLFLLDRKGSYAAKVLSDVDQVERLQACLTASERDRRAARASLKIRQSDLAAVRADLAAQGDLAPLSEGVAAAERAAADLRASEERVAGMAKLRERAEAARSRLKAASSRLAELDLSLATLAAAPFPQEADLHRLASGAPLALRAQATEVRFLRGQAALAQTPEVPELPPPPRVTAEAEPLLLRAGRVASARSSRVRLLEQVGPADLPDPPPLPEVLASGRSSEYVASWNRLASGIRAGRAGRDALKVELDGLTGEIEALERAAPPCPVCGRLTSPTSSDPENPHDPADPDAH